MKLTYNTVYAAKPARVLAILADHDYALDYTTALRATSYKAIIEPTDPRLSIAINLLASTVNMPSSYRWLLGTELAIADTRTWQPTAHQTYEGTIAVAATARGRTARIAGTQRLIPHGTHGTRFTAHAVVDFNVPLIGLVGRRTAARLGRDALDQQSILVRRWLRKAR